ncbi:MAG: hypothetical protein FWB72_05550 [Firmicutes bacterium]|nr:hypothetical protein [Bacillota bacterium]
MSRTKSREITFQLIYEFLVTEQVNEHSVIELTREVSDSKELLYINTLYESVARGLDNFLQTIKGAEKDFVIERFYKIDLALVLLALAENTSFVKDVSLGESGAEVRAESITDTIKPIPKNVTINEVIDLSKKYSTEKSSQFINGVLGKILV